MEVQQQMLNNSLRKMKIQVFLGQKAKALLDLKLVVVSSVFLAYFCIEEDKFDLNKIYIKMIPKLKVAALNLLSE